MGRHLRRRSRGALLLSWSWLNGYLAPWGRDAFVLAARPDADGAGYVALLPLRLRTKERGNTEFCNEINLAGNYISDYAGFLCRPGFEEQALPALAAKVQQPNWRRLRLEETLRLRASGRALPARLLSGHVPDQPPPSLVNPDGTDNSICPSVTLPDDWDRYLETRVSSNTRQKIRRFLRQVEELGSLPSSPTRMPTPLHAISTFLLMLWTQRWAGQKGKRLRADPQCRSPRVATGLHGGDAVHGRPLAWRSRQDLRVRVPDRRSKEDLQSSA